MVEHMVAMVESSCDGGVQLCWWSGVESYVMVEYSFVGRVEWS